MSVTRDIVETYRAPRRVVRRHLDAPGSEGRVLMFLMLGCFLIFIAQWPRLSREAFVDPSIPLDARVGGTLIGWIFIAPLFFYALAGLSHLAARVLGGQGTGYGARVALFWALLAVSPLWLLYGLMAGFLGSGVELTLVGAPLFGVFVIFWGLGLREANARHSALGSDGQEV